MKAYFKYIILIVVLTTSIQSGFSQACVGEAGKVTWAYWYMDIKSFEALHSLENFPDHPDGSKQLGSLNTPDSYEDRFGSLVRGFIRVPTSGTATFNVTGDDQTQFYLSTDDTKANLSLICEVESYTNWDQHDKYPEQTSAVIALTAGEYYYFELYNIESTGRDHAQVYWQRSWTADTDWLIVDFSHIYSYGCESNCPERGTPCNDNNTLTYDDQEDGFCNCVGVYPSSNTCIGERMKVDAYYYDSIDGNNLSDLYESPAWPLMPSRKQNLEGAYGPLELSEDNDYGTYVQGYLTVPVSGVYDFNVTGDNQTQFFLSTDETLEKKEVNSVFITGSTDVTEHDKYEQQMLPGISLNAGQYYYYEFRHKENSYRDHFHLYWKASFYGNDTWKKFPKFYLYDYGCEIPCIPEGTLCDDGDPFTDNDAFNAYCECVGVPCMPGDCEEPGGNFNATEACAATDNLDIRPETSWMSCSTQPNPNIARSQGHWIRYDLGGNYNLNHTKIWNYNAPGLTDRGLNSVAVDYSLDGTTWTALGTFNWPEANGTVDYSGITGPNFNGTTARYVLITGISNHGAACYGFSKVLFNATHCGAVGTPCDDGDPFTQDDQMDANCNCVGQEMAINDCEQEMLNLGSTSLPEDNYSATEQVQSANTLAGGRAISFVAGESIIIMSGFTVGGGAELEASIEDCIQNIVSDEMYRALKAREANKKMAKSKPSILSLDERSNGNEEVDNTKSYREVIYRLDAPAEVVMNLVDSKGAIITTIVNRYHENQGTYKKYVPKSILENKNYSIKVQIDDQEIITPIPSDPNVSN